MILLLVSKNSLYNLLKVLTTVSRKYLLSLFRAVFLTDLGHHVIINPYLAEVLQHPQTIEMREGLLHIRDAEGPRRIESVETRLEAMEQQVSSARGWWKADSMPIT